MQLSDLQVGFEFLLAASYLPIGVLFLGVTLKLLPPATPTEQRVAGALVGGILLVAALNIFFASGGFVFVSLIVRILLAWTFTAWWLFLRKGNHA